MTLDAVAAGVRARAAAAVAADPDATANIQSISVLIGRVVDEFEADPQFGLPSRIEDLIFTLEHPDGTSVISDAEWRGFVARRLRGYLNGTLP